MQPFLPRAQWRRLLAGAIAAAAFLPPAAHAFDLTDTTGKPQRLADARGQWVVVNFWATWCAPCVKEIPDIAAFAREAGGKVRVIGIALDWDDKAKVIAFAKKTGHHYPLVLGDDNSEKALGKVKGLPTTLVFNPEGKIAYQKTGTVTRELLHRVVKGEKVQ
ncbi:MAG: TlpA family protein disulfide reductase [Betaproteobacteria bacterium]|nr:TlpA family protein disulfide reductase [Betaproteobacteria bacterium]